MVILFQLRIQFDDKAVSTHEYQSETSALAQYLEENPHEKDVVEKEQADIEQTSISLDLENSESSDDVVETPRDTVAMKSNTAIGAGTSVVSKDHEGKEYHDTLLYKENTYQLSWCIKFLYYFQLWLFLPLYVLIFIGKK